MQQQQTRQEKIGEELLELHRQYPNLQFHEVHDRYMARERARKNGEPEKNWFSTVKP